MTDIILTALIALPMAYVLSLYLLEEAGPFQVFWRIRKLAGFTKLDIPSLGSDSRAAVTSAEEVPGKGFWSEVLSCHRCLSPYVTAVIMIFLGLTGVSEWNTLLVVKWFTVTGLNVLVSEALD